MWLNDLFWGRSHFGGEISLFWGINEHFGGPSVHCGQILQQNPGNASILGAYGPPTPPLTDELIENVAHR